MTGGLPEEWFRQLAAEVFDPKARKWVKVYDRNEALDLLVYNAAAAMHRRVRINAKSASDWDALEQQFQPAAADLPPASAFEFGKTAKPARSGGFFPTSAPVGD